MADREKVIKALECLYENKPDKDCENCSYGMKIGPHWGCDFTSIFGNALALLKAREPCEDAVSKQAVILALEGEYSDWNNDYNIPITHCVEAVQSIPSVQPVPVARVMTLDLPPEEWQDKVIWLETKGKKPIPCLFRKCDDRMMFGRYERVMSFDAIGSSKEGGYFLRNYGVKWRCWTSCPTDAQRKETPWE